MFARGILGHVLTGMADLLNIRFSNTAIAVLIKESIIDIISLRTTTAPKIAGFHKRFVQLEKGIFGISNPAGYQVEAFFCIAPHIITLESLRYKAWLSVTDSKKLLTILIKLRSVCCITDPLINRVFSPTIVNHLIGLVSKSSHWLYTMVSRLTYHGVGQCDSYESMHK